MCYSARIKANLKELSWEFRAQLDMDEFEHLFKMRLRHPELKLPFALDRYFLLSREAAEARLAKYVKEHLEGEKARFRAELKEAEEELAAIGEKKPTKAGEKKIGVLERRMARLREKIVHSVDAISPIDDRIFPMYFAPVILEENGQRRLVPARYRVRNPDGSEVPSQYNVFNARHDSLMDARTWKPLFGKTHLIFPFLRFYEWVEKDGKKKEIYFAPENRDAMWAAGLYSVPKVGKAAGSTLDYRSFAMVTDDPPPEVAEAGHDRCPIFLQESQTQKWLEPRNFTQEELLLTLRAIEHTFYLHGLAV